MRPLDPDTTLTDLQQYVAAMETERGFNGSTVIEQALKLGEEVGELYKAIRTTQHLPADPNSITGTVDEELADILIYLCAIANRLDINLGHALIAKEHHNNTRTWTPRPEDPDNTI